MLKPELREFLDATAFAKKELEASFLLPGAARSAKATMGRFIVKKEDCFLKSNWWDAREMEFQNAAVSAFDWRYQYCYHCFAFEANLQQFLMDPSKLLALGAEEIRLNFKTYLYSSLENRGGAEAVLDESVAKFAARLQSFYVQEVGFPSEGKVLMYKHARIILEKLMQLRSVYYKKSDLWEDAAPDKCVVVDMARISSRKLPPMTAASTKVKAAAVSGKTKVNVSAFAYLSTQEYTFEKNLLVARISTPALAFFNVPKHLVVESTRLPDTAQLEVALALQRDGLELNEAVQTALFL